MPTYNRAGYLRRALEGLTRQTLERDEFEIVVIDDGSSDETRRVIDLFRESLQVIYLYQENAGISVAKNLGVAKARAPILVFLDDDDVARLTLLEEHLWSHERYTDLAVAVLGHTELSRRVAAIPLMHFVTEVAFYLFCYPRIRVDEWLDYTYFWGGRSSCKKALLRKYGCFNPRFQFGCEDIELGYRLSQFGLRVVYNPRAVSTMVRPLTFDDFCRRMERQGSSNWVFGELYPTDEVMVWGDIPGAQERWAMLEPYFETILANARRLDDMANEKIEKGLKLDSALVTELHRAYWQSFDGCRLRGIVKAAAKSVKQVEPVMHHS
jgi:glycosyltransferase involved in cell wall biosynthesis